MLLPFGSDALRRRLLHDERLESNGRAGIFPPAILGDCARDAASFPRSVIRLGWWKKDGIDARSWIPLGSPLDFLDTAVLDGPAASVWDEGMDAEVQSDISYMERGVDVDMTLNSYRMLDAQNIAKKNSSIN